jgi:hypothetical protein
MHAHAQESTSDDRGRAAETVASTQAVSPMGRAILDAAWKHRREADDLPDCSHLVHDVYTLAGYSYPYATSSQLYDGVDQFRRVKTPEAGDLIVWPGHAGIVVDPAAHSFYSSQRTGLKLDFYDSRWWRRRSQPRFYRYNAVNAVRAAEVASNTGPEEGRTAKGDGEVMPAASNNTEAAETPSLTTREPAASLSSLPADSRVQLRSPKLTKAAIVEAIQRMTRNSAQEADGDKDFQGAVVDRISVKRIRVSGSHGTAQVQIATRANLTTDSAEMRKERHTVRVNLERSGHVWFADLGGDTNFISTDAAVAALSVRLADLARANAPRAEQARVVTVLQALLRKPQ